MFAGVNYSTHTAVNFSTPVFVSVTVLLNGEEEWACFFWILFFLLPKHQTLTVGIFHRLNALHIHPSPGVQLSSGLQNFEI